MYPINPLNPAMYPEDKRYMCGHWLVEYEKLHQGNKGATPVINRALSLGAKFIE